MKPSLQIRKEALKPLSWPAPAYCQILDLQKEHYDDVLRLLKHHYFLDDPMCKSVNFHNDDMSIKNYLDVIRTWMRDTTSFVAISSKSGRVVGSVIAKFNSVADKSITYSRIQIREGEALEKIMNLKNVLVKRGDVFNKLNCNIIFRIYILCVHPSYQNKNLESALLEAFFQVAIASDISAIAGVFTSYVHQSIAEKLGFQKMSEIFYSQWLVDNEIVFDNPGAGNYSVAFMGMQTPSLHYLVNFRRIRERQIFLEEEQKKYYQKYGKIKY